MIGRSDDPIEARAGFCQAHARLACNDQQCRPDALNTLPRSERRRRKRAGKTGGKKRRLWRNKKGYPN